MTFCNWRVRMVSLIRVWSMIDQLTLIILNYQTRSAIFIFTPQRIDYSNCAIWNRLVRIMGNRWYIEARFLIILMPSGWISIISLKQISNFQYVAIPGACCMTRDSGSISIFMAALTGTSVFFQVVAWAFRFLMQLLVSGSAGAVEHECYRLIRI